MISRIDDPDAVIGSIGELVGSLAHDLKGLLSGIDGGMYIASSGLKKGDQTRIDSGFGMAKRNLARINRTVSHLLYFVKDREVSWEPVDLEEVLDAVHSTLEGHAADLQISLRAESDTGTFESWELAVRSLLLNLAEYLLTLLGNVADKETASVVLSSRLEDRRVVFDVTGTGIELTQETIDRALEPYYEPDGSDRSHLAVFVANKIIHSLGGGLDISTPGDRITRFTVELPRTKPGD